MAMSVSGSFSPNVSRRASKFSRKRASASLKLPCSCRRSARLLIARSVFGCLEPLCSRRAARASRYRDSASANLPCSLSNVARLLMSDEVPHSSSDKVASMSNAMRASHLRNAVSTLSLASSTPMVLSTVRKIVSVSSTSVALAALKSTRESATLMVGNSFLIASWTVTFSSGGSTISRLQSPSVELRISHRHQERSNGTGLLRGLMTRQEFPMEDSNSLCTFVHQILGLSTGAWWLIVKRSMLR
mmetsp:Transcript_16084/g.45156  ORF Transcript_16084/g.45156 Transcript_16084/m.45156 type:complete len:245 (-) Transcript_16084:739-1473(-)